MSKLNRLPAVLMLAFSCGIANAGLIINGGFEEPDINKRWTYGEDPTGGWKGDNIEVWESGFLGVTSFEGGQHGELNAHPYDKTDWSIYQSFDTVLDDLYSVSFAYRARKNNDEAFLFTLSDGNNSIFDEVIDDHVTNHWSVFSDTFFGTGNELTIRFTSLVPEKGTVGNFIDAVEVVKVPEPGMLSLMGVGLLGLVGLRRRTKHS